MSDNPEIIDSGEKRWVTMSNALTRAGHTLSLPEKRLVSIAISKLNPKQPLLPGVELVTKITAVEYAETFDIDSSTAYTQLKTAAAESGGLFDRYIRFYEVQKKRKGKSAEATVNVVRWVSRVAYHDGEGWIQVYWTPSLVPHLIGLKGSFTEYLLQQASALRSTYSWRMLELLERFKAKNGTGWAQYAIDDFAIAMDATEKQKADFAAIRRKIIEPAIRELTEKDGWLIHWEPVKAGRKVTAVRFKFERDPQGKLQF